MPFTRPTLDQLRLRIKTDLMSRLPGTDALLRRNNLGIIGDVEAGAAHLLYGRLEWSFLQLFPDTAEGPFLERWASIWGVTREPATKATGTLRFGAAAGSSIPPGGIATRRDGVQFNIVTGGSVDNTTGLINVGVEAAVAGTDGNTATDVQMTLATTLPGVSSLGYVNDPGLAGGAPQESDAMLLQRLLLRIKSPPSGGTAADYVQWALEVPGVTRAWCYPLELGPGNVTVRFMMDQVRLSAQGIPEPADVALVQAHIDTLKPVTAVVTVVAPVPLPVDVHINGLVNDTPDTRAAINQQLLNLMVNEAAPGTEMFPSQIISAINGSQGVERFRLLSPITSIVPATGEIPILGALDFS